MFNSVGETTPFASSYHVHLLDTQNPMTVQMTTMKWVGRDTERVGVLRGYHCLGWAEGDMVRLNVDDADGDRKKAGDIFALPLTSDNAHSRTIQNA